MVSYYSDHLLSHPYAFQMITLMMNLHMHLNCSLPSDNKVSTLA